MKIVRSPRGESRREVELSEVQVPNLLHLYEELAKDGRHHVSGMVLETWHLTHDLLWNLQEIEHSQAKA